MTTFLHRECRSECENSFNLVFTVVSDLEKCAVYFLYFGIRALLYIFLNEEWSEFK
jgi:hypothetical protein